MMISGRVQGVFYRVFSKKEADSLGVRGYVRNLDDGRVELVAEGSEEKLEKLVEACRKGPAMARVDDIRIEKSGSAEGFKNFEIRT